MIRRLFVLLALVFLPLRASAQAADTLRGRVFADSGVAIAGAEVIATRAPDRAFKSALTDQDGRYEIVFEQGTGDYLLHASAIGRKTARYRVRQSGSDSQLTHDFQLKSSVQQLAPVTVAAARNVPERDRSLFGTEPGESGKQVDGVTGAISPGDQGNIVAMAATVPGVSVTPEGISMLGLGPSQNSTTLNGMAFSGADVPRTARTYTNVSGSSYDPSRGWFSGALVNVELSPGSIFSSRKATLTLDAPALQYTDRVSRALGQRFSNTIGSLGGSGSFALDKMNYSFGVEAGRRTSNFASLEGGDADLLRRSGIEPDSVSRVLDLITAAGIPISAPAGLESRKSDYLSFIGRIDHRSYNPTTFQAEKQSWGLLGYAKLQRSAADGIILLAPSGRGGESSQQILSVQALYSTYLRNSRYLTEARTALTVKRDRANPFLSIPQGQVFVSSSVLEDSPAVAPVFFGGNSGLERDWRDWTWETNSVTRFYTSPRSKHRVQLTASSRIDGFARSTGSNNDGTFSFNSLADLSANLPRAFTRTLNAPVSSAKTWNAFAAVGDYWRKSSTLQVLYGARLEANRFLDRPGYNPEIERVFGVRTDRAPTGFHASPRLGFTWLRKPGGDGIRYTSVGTFRLGAPSYIRGGIGEFRSFLSPILLSEAMVANGLSTAATQLTCIGRATPIPDWAAYQQDRTTIPRQCISGVDIPGQFSDATPRIQLFDPSYRPARSWRANLSYASTFRSLAYSVEGIYSLNLDQPGRVDLNFDNITRFRTSTEDRPVFVDPGSIVPASGLLSNVDARKSAAFGSVISNRSNLRSNTEQLTVVLSPVPHSVSGWFLSTAYTLSSVRALAGGFDAPTFDSPLHRSWSRGELSPRHQIILQAGKTIKRVTVTLFGPFQSGLPFTPLVSSDVNGDGRANDRAYLFLPGTAGSSAFDDALANLKAGAPSKISNCLTRQSGRAAARNSCEGPWTANLHAQLTASVGRTIGLRRTAIIALGIDNPLGGIDQLLHGSRRLRGWGSRSIPDPVLYNVRGFDAARNSFVYEVNPRFGNTHPSRALTRTPFRVTLDVSMDIAAPLPMQQIERWLGAGRGSRPGPRLTSDELKKRFARNVPNPYRAILNESDSLLLSPEQESALQAAQTAYLRAVDSLWDPLTKRLAELPVNFNARAAARQQDDLVAAVWEHTRLDIQRTLPAILNATQLTLLPGNVRFLFTAKKPVQVRMFMMG